MTGVCPTSKQKTEWMILAFFGILLFVFVSAACGLKESNIPDEVKENIRKRIENEESVGMVVGFINPQGRRDYFCVGTLTMGGDEPVDENSIYEIGSISKAFTGIVLADMVVNNELRLDDPAEIYLPETVKVPSRNGEEITLEHLATHTSALARMPSNFHPADLSNPYADYSVENMYEFISGYTLRRDIGEKYEYSNLGMGLLGHILSLKAGMDYEQLISERICKVLGMDSTVISLTEGLKERLARGHNPAGEVPNWDMPTLAGAGAILSTAHDMLTFLAANMGINPSKLSAAMDMSHEARVDASKNMKIGLGWHISDNGTTQIIWHNGGTGGYRTFCGFIKDEKIGVVVLSNMNISADDIGFHLLDSSYELKNIKEPS
jgi:D-alanyl-D-alanine-carboxypeptidase/D-alanyl-D-alanine-endopeptidase